MGGGGGGGLIQSRNVSGLMVTAVCWPVDGHCCMLTSWWSLLYADQLMAFAQTIFFRHMEFFKETRREDEEALARRFSQVSVVRGIGGTNSFVSVMCEFGACTQLLKWVLCEGLGACTHLGTVDNYRSFLFFQMNRVQMGGGGGGGVQLFVWRFWKISLSVFSLRRRFEKSRTVKIPVLV